MLQMQSMLQVQACANGAQYSPHACACVSCSCCALCSFLCTLGLVFLYIACAGSMPLLLPRAAPGSFPQQTLSLHA
jgi:hypothetical protein